MVLIININSYICLWRVIGKEILMFYKGITGDIHREIDLYRLGNSSWPVGTLLDKNDLLFVAGDFGLIWDLSPNELRLREWLEDKSWTTLFIDGNHENHDALKTFPVEERWGGKVGIISPSIIWLKRGEVYEIDGIKIFVFGGADSIDKHLRLPGRDWWSNEIPSYSEYENAVSNLNKHNWKVDYVITHTVPHHEVPTFSNENLLIGTPHSKYEDPTTFMLQDIKDKLKFKKWYFGHFHIDKTEGRFTCLYRDIIKLGDDVEAIPKQR